MSIISRVFFSFVAFAGVAGAGMIGPLSGSDWDASAFNIVTLGNGASGNFTSSSDIGGRIAVFGAYANQAPVDQTPYNPYSETYSMIVNGAFNVNPAITVGGSVYLPNSGKSLTQLTGDFNSPKPTIITTGASDFNFADATTALDTLSSTAIPNAAQAANVVSTGSYELLDVTGNSCTLCVFNVPYSDLSNANLPFEVNVKSSQSLIVNVTGAPAGASITGTIVEINGQQINANTSSGVPVLFNFAGVTSLGSSRTIEGSVLAPYAVVNTNQDLDGQLFAAAVSGIGEVHDQYFNGILPSSVQPVPEPATMVLTGAGLIALGMLRRRR